MDTWLNFRFKLIVEGILVGLFSGMIIVLYRFALETVGELSSRIYSFQLTHAWMIPVWILCLIAGALVTGWIVKNQPMVSGSGIPQVKGVLQRKLSMNWWKVILGKFIGGTISIGAGLSLGREGPSVQIGAAVGQGYSKVFKKIKVEENYLITCGASAGLAAAFNAPIAGAIFALEEMHKNFSPLVMISALAASLSADFVAKEFFGLNPVFNFSNIVAMPLNQYFFLIVLGVIVGILGIAFNKALVKTQDWYQNQKWLSVQARPVIPFLLAGLLGLVLPQVLGGGNGLVNSILAVDFPIKMLLIFLAVKFVFTMLSYGSSAPGGIFLPLLVIGALIGVIYSKALFGLLGYDQTYMANFMILAMAGYFAAVVKAPMTGIVLITEMTGSFSNLLSTGVVCLCAYMVTELLDSKPIYETLLDRMLHKGIGKHQSEKDAKVLVEVPVCCGSLIEGKQVKEMDWPSYCLIVGIKRGETEIIPNGDVFICSGDYLVILTNEDTAASVRDCVTHLAEV